MALNYIIAFHQCTKIGTVKFYSILAFAVDYLLSVFGEVLFHFLSIV
jgi:hypothetical protein